MRPIRSLLLAACLVAASLTLASAQTPNGAGIPKTKQAQLVQLRKLEPREQQWERRIMQNRGRRGKSAKLQPTSLPTK